VWDFFCLTRLCLGGTGTGSAHDSELADDQLRQSLTDIGIVDAEIVASWDDAVSAYLTCTELTFCQQPVEHVQVAQEINAEMNSVMRIQELSDAMQ
jgi:hypothetical protein